MKPARLKIEDSVKQLHTHKQWKLLRLFFSYKYFFTHLVLLLKYASYEYTCHVFFRWYSKQILLKFRATFDDNMRATFHTAVAYVYIVYI